MIYAQMFILLTASFTIVGVLGYALLNKNNHPIVLGILSQLIVCCMCLLYHMSGITITV
jgi:hypothetical protein